MKRWRIAVYPGDGIGTEVIAQALRVLRAVEKRQQEWTLDLVEFPWGRRLLPRNGARGAGRLSRSFAPVRCHFTRRGRLAG